MQSFLIRRMLNLDPQPEEMILSDQKELMLIPLQDIKLLIL